MTTNYYMLYVGKTICNYKPITYISDDIFKLHDLYKCYKSSKNSCIYNIGDFSSLNDCLEYISNNQNIVKQICGESMIQSFVNNRKIFTNDTFFYFD